MERQLKSSASLDSLASLIEANHTWQDLVMTKAQFTTLHKIIDQLQMKKSEDHIIKAQLSVKALFAGVRGTDKTMAAEIIAKELGLDLYKIDLSGVVSKYIGETEKNLDRIFNAAENANAILLFDEADALFGKRSEVRDSHDRYANIEIDYFLQRMESYRGLSIIATTKKNVVDPTHLRRVHFIVNFPLPRKVPKHAHSKDES